MLGSMTPELHRQFELHYPYDMIQELRSMFEKQAGVEKFDLIQSFHACKQEEGKSVADYVLKNEMDLWRTGTSWLYATQDYLSRVLILNGTLLKILWDLVTDIGKETVMCILLIAEEGDRKLVCSSSRFGAIYDGILLLCLLSFGDSVLESASPHSQYDSNQKVDKTPYELWIPKGKRWVTISTSHLKQNCCCMAQWIGRASKQSTTAMSATRIGNTLAFASEAAYGSCMD
ncbi:hypothetical protein Tco_0761248 [Tanacetum coccineum]